MTIQVVDQLGDWRWRIANLYYIVNEQGKRVRFSPNDVQHSFLDDLHWLNLILKARQHGFTTLIDIIGLDQTFFNETYAAQIIAHNLPDAEKIFRTKVRYPYYSMPSAVLDMNPLTKETQSELIFSNGSSIAVGVSARSSTLQFLHISEYGKICRRYPDKADEIKTGSIPAVHAGGIIVIESTAEGTGGHFYTMVKEAEKRIMYTPNDAEFRLHFYAWWKKESYRLNPNGIEISREREKYFAELQGTHGVYLDEEQKAWYEMKARIFNDDMQQEYPSTPDEAFAGAMRERYFSEQMAVARRQGRIKNIPIIEGRTVNLYFDIGRDTTAIWFHQYAALEHRFIDYFQDSGKTMAYYVAEIRKKGYVIGNIYLPHDAADKSVVTDVTAEAVIKQLMPGIRTRIVPRVPQITMGINAARSIISECYFHETNCAEGIECLENYRKKWSDTLGNWLDEPVHDQYSHGADAFRQFAQGWDVSHESDGRPSTPRIAPYQTYNTGTGVLG